MERSEEQESTRVPLTAMFRQLDSSTVEVDTTPDLAAGLARLTGWLRGTTARSQKLVPNETIADADSRSLVEAARRGNREAFGVLYDRYVDKVFRYVLWNVGDRVLAEDITSETFLRALRSITTVRFGIREVDKWLVTIARKLIFDHFRSSQFRLETTTADFSAFERTEVEPEQPDRTADIYETLVAGIRRLGADQRRCITLRFLEDQSVAQTAKVMNRNEATVRALQHRAVRHLARLLPSDLSG